MFIMKARSIKVERKKPHEYIFIIETFKRLYSACRLHSFIELLTSKLTSELSISARRILCAFF